MQTLKKFTSFFIEIKLSLTTSKDKDFFKGKYKVTEKTRNNQFKWVEVNNYYDNLDYAQKEMLKRISDCLN